MSTEHAAILEELFEAKLRIESLEKENAALMEAQRWIPVGERLPTNQESRDRSLPPHVLVVCKAPSGEKYVTARTYSTLHKEWITHDPITHWMPLPAPPTTDKGAK